MFVREVCEVPRLWGMSGGLKRDSPSLLLVEVSGAVGDLLVLVAGHGVAGLLLDEVEC